MYAGMLCVEQLHTRAAAGPLRSPHGRGQCAAVSLGAHTVVRVARGMGRAAKVHTGRRLPNTLREDIGEPFAALEARVGNAVQGVRALDVQVGGVGDGRARCVCVRVCVCRCVCVWVCVRAAGRHR